MFGFINVYKNELKIKDYNMFKAYYCGLCKTLGKKYNQLVRLGLSYDLTFLAILADSLNEDLPSLKQDGCVKHIGMHTVCYDNPWIDYASDVSIILFYYKLCDDIADDKSLKAFLMRIPYISAFKKVCKKYPELCDSIRNNLHELSLLEKAKCPSVDMAADPFAKLTEDIFSYASPSLAKLGYNIGRFIYIADAFGDIKDDKKSKSYNPFLFYDDDYLDSLSFRERIRGTFNMTLSAVAKSYNDLCIKKNKNITDNIIYLGLRHTSEQLFKDNGGENE